MVNHEGNQHMSQPMHRQSGTRVRVAQMKKFDFNRRQSETLWKKWLPCEVSNYQKKMETHYRTR